ncbi:MAG: SLC13/DASS family transporter, partial [Bacteroidales bacterium]|nr:SLC13/DASS family transporter [Bacteroidales bacterium]
GKAVSSAYFNDIIFLFIGGFLVALAMQRWNLHKRIALRILMITGVSPGRILLGFMLSTAFLSMWISNTATAMMMIPIVISILSELELNVGEKKIHHLSIGLLLGIAYSASIGGIATLVGTPPNLAFSKIYSITFPQAPEISFGQWMVFALPVSLIMLIILWFYLYLIFMHGRRKIEKIADPMVFRDQYIKLGSQSFEEKVVLWDFAFFALLLLFRSNISLGSFTIPGWSSLVSNPSYLNDGTVAITLGIILFLIPSKSEKNSFVMDWETTRDIPWNIILLFGGGFALADGFVQSGLSVWIGNQLSVLANYHVFIIIVGISTVMIFLTEVTSNTATTQMLLPILAGLAVSTHTHPLLFMLPATIAASMAFMLPVATPPNAIIFGTNRIQIADMARTGLVLNLIGIIVISLMVWLFGISVFDMQHGILPDWATLK